MGSRRGTSGLCGVLALDKPYGMTSHDVVDRVRAITGERRVGHAGTLDPAATGLMLVGVGAATRLSEYLTGHDKEYVARIVFGATTDTDDAQGRVLSDVCDEELTGVFSMDVAQSTLEEFTGAIDQIPPAYSAIKKNGVVAYKAAREGKRIDFDVRSVTVREAELIQIGMTESELDDGSGDMVIRQLPYWDVRFAVSKGTYVRALARDIGAYLGCGAYLGALRRTSIAGTSISDACSIEELEKRAGASEAYPWCNPARLLGFPVVELEDAQARSVANGRDLDDLAETGDGLVSCVRDGRLLAVYRKNGAACKPRTVIPGGVVGVV